jgi:nucleoside phosphorylase
MCFRIKLKWKIVSRLVSPEAAERLHNGLLFNRRGGKSFVHSIGGRIRTDYEPVTLEPTDVFHHTLSKRKEALGLQGNKFPYPIVGFPFGGSNRLNVSIRLFGQFACVTIELDSFEVNANTDLLSLQKLESYPKIAQFARIIVGIVVSADRHAPQLPSLPKYFPAVQVVSQDSGAVLTELNLVELVTHHPLPRDTVISAVMEKNHTHQVDQSTLLVDKLGIVSYVPWIAKVAISGNSQRFENTCSMLELAAILKAHFVASINLPEGIIRVISSSSEAIPESVSAQNTWNLIVSEFGLKSALENSSTMQLQPIKEKILIVAVTSVEVEAILSAFAKETGKASRSIKQDGYVYQCLGQIGEYEVFLAISEMGTGGVTGSQESVRRAISAIKPHAVFMVGIAFGVNKQKFAVGDILVSKQLLLYELQRVGSGSKIILRGDKVPASASLLNWIRHATPTWVTGHQAKVEPGLILSGEKLIDSLDFRQQLIVAAPEAIGGEMEGAGLYVSCENENVPWILVKAICDWADGNKGRNKKANQQVAAINASAFVLHVLKSTSS